MMCSVHASVISSAEDNELDINKCIEESFQSWHFTLSQAGTYHAFCQDNLSDVINSCTRRVVLTHCAINEGREILQSDGMVRKKQSLCDDCQIAAALKVE